LNAKAIKQPSEINRRRPNPGMMAISTEEIHAVAIHLARDDRVEDTVARLLNEKPLGRFKDPEVIKMNADFWLLD